MSDDGDVPCFDSMVRQEAQPTSRPTPLAAPGGKEPSMKALQTKKAPLHPQDLLPLPGPFNQYGARGGDASDSDAPPLGKDGPAIQIADKHSGLVTKFQDELFDVLRPGRPVGKPRKRSRIDWRRPHNKAVMDTAIDAWNALPATPTEKDPESRGGISRYAHAVKANVPVTTFKRRMDSTDPKDVPSYGRRPLIPPREQRAIVDAVAMHDAKNHGLGIDEIVRMVANHYPNLSDKQATNIWYSSLKKDACLTGSVIADRMTAKRTSAVNEMDQTYWFAFVEKTRQTLEERSTLEEGGYANCKKTGKPYKEVLCHFIMGCDEEGVCLSLGRNRIVGKYGKKSHFSLADSTRKSGTAVRTGSAAGVKGPTVFILRTAAREQFITTQYLLSQGAPPGSIYTTNAAAYMTDDTWDSIASEYCKGLRNMDPIVAANPRWWIEFHVDGCHAHVNTLAAQKIFRSYNICIVQSQSHTSHINQAFDDVPGKVSKVSQRIWLSAIRNDMTMFGIADDDALLLAMLESEKAITSEAWKKSFINVNLNPDNCMPIQVWLSKISDHLIAAGDDTRLLFHGIVLTPEEVELEYQLQQLKAIKPPNNYLNLTDEEKKMALDTVSNEAFWEPTTFKKTLQAQPALAKLKLDQGTNAHQMWKFSAAMGIAIKNKLADEDAVLPSLKWALANIKTNEQYAMLLRKRKARRDQSSTSKSIGVNIGNDLESYDMTLRPTETRLQCLDRLDQMRKRDRHDMAEHLDLTMTVAQRQKYMSSSQDIRTGNMMRDANALGVRGISNNMGEFGQADGHCKIANSDDRITRMEMAKRVRDFAQNMQKMNADIKADVSTRKRDGMAALVSLAGEEANNKSGWLSKTQMKVWIERKLPKIAPYYEKKSAEEMRRFLLELCSVRAQDLSIELVAAADRAIASIEQEDAEDEESAMEKLGTLKRPAPGPQDESAEVDGSKGRTVKRSRVESHTGGADSPATCDTVMEPTKPFHKRDGMTALVSLAGEEANNKSGWLSKTQMKVWIERKLPKIAPYYEKQSAEEMRRFLLELCSVRAQDLNIELVEAADRAMTSIEQEDAEEDAEEEALMDKGQDAVMDTVKSALGTEPAGADGEAAMPTYAQKRADNIRANNEMLKTLKLDGGMVIDKLEPPKAEEKARHESHDREDEAEDFSCSEECEEGELTQARRDQPSRRVKSVKVQYTEVEEDIDEDDNHTGEDQEDDQEMDKEEDKEEDKEKNEEEDQEKVKEEVKYKYDIGDSLAFHACNENGDEEPFVGEVLTLGRDGKGLPTYLLHYFDMATDESEPNAGGCYEKVQLPDKPTEPWTENVSEDHVLAKIVWEKRGDCSFYMGDSQWDHIEEVFNVAFEVNHKAASLATTCTSLERAS